MTSVRPGIHLLSPLVLPGKDRLGIAHATQILIRHSVRRALDELGRNPHALLQQSPHHSILGRVPTSLAVYYATDNFSAGADLMGLDRQRLLRYEDDVISHADLILAVSEPIALRLADRGPRVELLTNGVDTAAFASVTRDRPSDRHMQPVGVVTGTLSERIDLGVLEALVDSGMHLLLVGPNNFRSQSKRFSALLARSQVDYRGEVPFEELPDLYRLADVGLVPYVDTEFNRSSFPLKTLEYLAAGLPVVSTGLPQIAFLGSEDIVPTSSALEFVIEAHRASTSPPDAETIRRRREVAELHSWRRRAIRLEALLGLEQA